MTLDLSGTSAREQLRAMRTGELSPVEVCESTIDLAERTKSLEAFITLDPEGALAAARTSSSRIARGVPRPLEGLPVPLKDVEATKGLRTTHGTLLMRESIPTEDGATAAAVRDAGAVIFGKTNTCAFAYTDDSTNMLGLTSRNPLDPKRSAGGSSGGAAAAVAAGVCRVAHATDGAGSARQPAALCGLVGFKPTFGRIPRYPMSDLWNARSHAGIIAKTVDDVAIAMSGFARFDPRDPLSIWEVTDWTGIHAADRKRRARVAYFSSWGNGRVDSEVAGAAEHAVGQLVEWGCELVEPKVDTASMAQVFEDNYSAQFAYDLRGLGEQRHLIDEGVLDALDYGAAMTLVEFLASRDKRGQFNARMVDLFKDIDFFLSPAQSSESWLVSEGPQADGTPLLGRAGDRMELLLLFNLLGWPAISVPCGTTSSGMPVGLQIAAMRGGDVALLEMAYAAEEIVGP